MQRHGKGHPAFDPNSQRITGSLEEGLTIGMLPAEKAAGYCRIISGSAESFFLANSIQPAERYRPPHLGYKVHVLIPNKQVAGFLGRTWLR